MDLLQIYIPQSPLVQDEGQSAHRVPVLYGLYIALASVADPEFPLAQMKGKIT